MSSAEVPPQASWEGMPRQVFSRSLSSAPLAVSATGTGDGFVRPLTLDHNEIGMPPGPALIGTAQGFGNKSSGLWRTAHPAVVAAWDGYLHTLSRIGYRLRRFHAIASRGLGFNLVSCQYSSDWRRAMETASRFTRPGGRFVCRTRNIPQANIIQTGLANVAGRVAR